MSDPAFAAARLADERSSGDYEFGDLVAAARSAHESVQDLHRRVPLYLDCDYSGSRVRDVCEGGFESADGEWCCPTCTESDGGPVYVCAECRDEGGDRVRWPCATAERVYRSSQLAEATT